MINWILDSLTMFVINFCKKNSWTNFNWEFKLNSFLSGDLFELNFWHLFIQRSRTLRKHIFYSSSDSVSLCQDRGMRIISVLRRSVLHFNTRLAKGRHPQSSTVISEWPSDIKCFVLWLFLKNRHNVIELSFFPFSTVL